MVEEFSYNRRHKAGVISELVEIYIIRKVVFEACNYSEFSKLYSLNNKSVNGSNIIPSIHIWYKMMILPLLHKIHCFCYVMNTLRAVR